MEVERRRGPSFARLLELVWGRSERVAVETLALPPSPSGTEAFDGQVEFLAGRVGKEAPRTGCKTLSNGKKLPTV